MKKDKFIHWFVIIVMTLLYFSTSIISTIHVVDFFQMTNVFALALSLAIGFELGAAASLASITILEKANKPLVWALFIILTLFQAMGNTYSTYVSAHNYIGFVELFGLTDLSNIAQKRILAGLSGAILPLVALGYIKSLVDYLKPTKKSNRPKENDNNSFDDFFNDTPKKKSTTVEKEEVKKESDTKKLTLPSIKENLEKTFQKQKEIFLPSLKEKNDDVSLTKKVETKLTKDNKEKNVKPRKRKRNRTRDKKKKIENKKQEVKEHTEKVVNVEPILKTVKNETSQRIRPAYIKTTKKNPK